MCHWLCHGWVNDTIQTAVERKNIWAKPYKLYVLRLFFFQIGIQVAVEKKLLSKSLQIIHSPAVSFLEMGFKPRLKKKKQKL